MRQEMGRAKRAREREVPGLFGPGPEEREKERAEFQARSGGIPVCSVQGRGGD